MYLWCLFYYFFAIWYDTRDLYSPTRDWTHALCSGSVGSLDLQESPCLCLFMPSSDSVSSVQSLSCVWLFVTPWIAARQASQSITNSRSLLKLMPIESVMPSSHLIPCRPLLLLPPIPPSIRVFPVSELFAWGGPISSIQFPSDRLGIFQFSSILMLSTRRGRQIAQGKGSDLQDWAHLPRQSQSQSNHNPNYRSNPSTGCPLCFWPTGYGLESPVLLSGVINLLEWLTELRETLSSFLQKHVIQERKNEKLRARSVGRSLELRCPLRVYLCLPAPHLFTNQDVHWTLFFRGFMEVSLHRQE